MRRMIGFLMLALVTVALASCNSSPGFIDSNPKMKAYYASDDFSLFAFSSLQDAGAEKASSNASVPDIYAVKGSDLATLSEGDTILAVRTCLEGKTIVIDSPTLAQLDAFWEKIIVLLDREEYEFLKAEHELSPYTIHSIIVNYGHDEGDDEEYTNCADEHVYEAIGMRRGDLYYVHDIDEIVDSSSGHKYKGAGNSEIVEIAYDGKGNNAPSRSVPETDYVASTDDDWTEVIKHTIKLFSDWLKGASSSDSNDGDKELLLSKLAGKDAQSALSNLQKARTITFSYTTTYSYASCSHYDGRLNGKKEVVQTFFDVWTACDIANQKEYYLARTSVVFNNQQLGGIHGFSYSSQEGYEGPYLDAASVSVSLPGGILRVTDCSPQNASGSTNFTTGSSFTIGGSVGGTAAGPTGGVNAGITVSQSTSRSIPDTSIVFTPTTNGSQGGDKSAWNVSAPHITLRKDENYFWNSKWLCEAPKPIQTNAATFDFYSLYTRPSSYDKNNRNAMFEVCTTTGLCVTSVWLKDAYVPYPVTTDYSIAKWVRHHLPFTRPNNLSGEYLMSFSAPRGSTQNEISLMSAVLKDYFTEWDANVKYYAFGDNSSDASRDSALDPVACNYFTMIKQKMTANQNVIKSRGVKEGEYTFYIQRARDGRQVKSFTMTF